MKYLISGGAGFIGSHLVNHLLREGNQVVVVDDFSTGNQDNIPLRKNLTIYPLSILDTFDHLFEGIDMVYHLAALTRPRESFVQPEETNRVNVDGTLKILRHCRDNKVKRLVFVSSASMYGDQEVFPISEEATPTPMSPYALTKLIGEQYCGLFKRIYNLDFNIVRPFNVYGPRQNPEGEYAAAVPTFIDTLNNGEIPFITGDGKQFRDFVYIDDVIELLVLAGKSKAHGEVFNAGSGKSTSINDLFGTVCKVMNKKVKPDTIPEVIDPDTLADISKAKKLLGWEPKIDLEEGIKRTNEKTYRN